MRVRLRNLLAEACLAALRDARESAALQAVAAFAERTDPMGSAEGLSAEQLSTLAETRCFEVDGARALLAPDLRGDLPALRARVTRLLEVTAEIPGRCGSATPRGDSVSWSLCAAEALFNAGLFFEVHELLEGDWRRAAGDLKTLLQGLIQVAVGLHHQTEGNIRGALTRLRAGAAKLGRLRPAAAGIELEGFCSAVEQVVAQLEAAPGAPVGLPRLVAPQRSSRKMR